MLKFICTLLFSCAMTVAIAQIFVFAPRGGGSVVVSCPGNNFILNADDNCIANADDNFIVVAPAATACDNDLNFAQACNSQYFALFKGML